MSENLFFDIGSTLIRICECISKKKAAVILQMHKNEYKAFLCIESVPISIMKIIKNIGFNGMISLAGGFIKENLELTHFLKKRKNKGVRIPANKVDILNNKVNFIFEDRLAFYNRVKYLSRNFNIVIFSKETDDFINDEIVLKNCTKDAIDFSDSMNDYQMIEAAEFDIVSYLAPEKLKAITNDTFVESGNKGIYKCMKQLKLI